MTTATPVSNSGPSYDVVVAGAGLVGATFALLLAEASAGALTIALVEARPAPEAPLAEAPLDSRVVAVSEASRRLLDRVGVWGRVGAGRVCPYTRMEVWDHEGTGFIEFDATEVRAPDLGHIVESRALTAALWERIAAVSAIELHCPVRICNISRVRNDRIELDLDGNRASTSLLVAADGARSPVREKMGFRVREWSYGHSAIVATVHTEKPHDFTARQWFGGTGPLALLPLRNGDGDCHYSAVVWSQQSAIAGTLMGLDADGFGQALTAASEYCLGAITALSGRECLPLQQRHAVDYIQSGIVLIGDAAHSIHPLAGQGVNLGLADAAVLTAELTRALAGGVNLGDAMVLGRYQRRRKPENLAMMAAVEGFKRLFEQPGPMLRLLRNQGMTQINALGPVNNLLIKQAMGLWRGRS